MSKQHILETLFCQLHLSPTADLVPRSGDECSRPEAPPQFDASGKEVVSPNVVLAGSDTTMVSQTFCFCCLLK